MPDGVPSRYSSLCYRFSGHVNEHYLAPTMNSAYAASGQQYCLHWYAVTVNSNPMLQYPSCRACHVSRFVVPGAASMSLPSIWHQCPEYSTTWTSFVSAVRRSSHCTVLSTDCFHNSEPAKGTMLCLWLTSWQCCTKPARRGHCITSPYKMMSKHQSPNLLASIDCDLLSTRAAADCNLSSARVWRRMGIMHETWCNKMKWAPAGSGLCSTAM